MEEYGDPGEAVVLVRPARAAAAPPSVFTPGAGPILWAPPPPPESDLNPPSGECLEGMCKVPLFTRAAMPGTQPRSLHGCEQR